MNDHSSSPADRFTIHQLAELTGFPLRSIRYYVQHGLVDKPVGVKRQAYYERRHLEQLVLIRKGQESGYSLQRIHQMIHQPERAQPVDASPTGSLSVKTHLQIGTGVELVVAPDIAGLGPDQLRALMKQCIDIIQELKEQNHD